MPCGSTVSSRLGIYHCFVSLSPGSELLYPKHMIADLKEGVGGSGKGLERRGKYAGHLLLIIK